MNKPTQEEISQRARQIWQERGSPAGRDGEIWLEAERQLAAGASDSNSGSAAYENSRTVSESKGASALAERVKTDTSSNHHLSPSTPEGEAGKAAQQTKEARAPKRPSKSAPKAKPPETGKPLWNQPHSS